MEKPLQLRSNLVISTEAYPDFLPRRARSVYACAFP
jgi:hypothetical protein